MTWPSFPNNNDTVTINGIKFIYDGPNSVWNREGFVFDTLAADSYTVSNLIVTHKAQLGAAGNVYIGGGQVGLFLTSDGQNGLAWSPPVTTQGISNGTSNVYVYNNSNITLTVGGVSNSAVFTSTGANLVGYANITGALNASTVTTGLITSNVTTGTAPLVITSTTRVANLNVERANVSDNTLTTRQTSGIYYPTFVSGNSTSTYSVGVSPNISFDTTNVVLATKNINITNNANVDNLSASSSVTSSNLRVSTNANLIGATILLGANANVKLTGGSSGQYLQTDGTGNLTWSTVSLSNISNGTSNVNVASSGNVTISVAGTSSVLTVSSSGSNIKGYANITGDITGGGNIDVSGNVNASIITSNVATGTSPLNVTSTTRVGNLNVARSNVSDYTSVTNINSGNVYVAFAGSGSTGNYALQSNTAIYANISNGNLYANNFIGNVIGIINGQATTAGTITASAQPNITSVGTLTGLTASGTVNFSSASTVNLGTYANVKIAGGTSGQYLKTDGAGNVSWSSITFSIVQSGTSNVSIPTVNGNINNYANGNLILVVTGTGSNITGYANVTGNITGGGNIDVPGNVNASILTSNVATGTAPIIVTSTTRVANLNVARSNISDYTLVTTTGTGNMNFTFASANTTANYSLNSNVSIYANLSTSTIYAANYVGNIVSGNSVTSNYIIANGTYLTALPAANLVGTVPLSTSATTAGTVTASAQPNITSTGSLTSLVVSGQITLQNTTELITVITGATGVVVHDTTSSATFHHITPSSNFTINFTNVPTTNNRSIYKTVIVVQGATPYVPNALQIDGVAQTILWMAGTASAGTANRTDFFGFTLSRINNAWLIYGYTSYFG